MESKYDITRNVVNFMTIIQLKYIYGNIIHACFTAGEWIFDANMLKLFPFRTTSLNIICSDENVNYINNTFSIIRREILFEPKYWNKVNYKNIL